MCELQGYLWLIRGASAEQYDHRSWHEHRAPAAQHSVQHGAPDGGQRLKY
jgi:hypothetical protein